jgi:hypothetical protein
LHRRNEVQDVRLILVDQILAPEKPVLRERWVVCRRSLGPNTVMLFVPGLHLFDGGDAIGCNHVAARVELLGVQPLPPLALAIGLGQARGVVAHTALRPLGVIAISDLEPVPGVRRVVAHAEAQTVSPRDLCPGSNDVPLGADVDGVPGMVLRGIGVEVVVMIGEGEEVLGPGALIQSHQPLGFPALRLPQIVNFHEAERRRMPVRREVVLVDGVTLYVHLPRIPVALLRHALSGPVCPDPELGVAEPVGNPVLLDERVPARPKWPGRE